MEYTTRNINWFKDAFNINSYADLQEKCKQHGVDIKHPYANFPDNPNKNLIVLDYNQLEATGADVFSRTCRGLVINCDDMTVVSRPFHRFFNYGEQSTDLFLNAFFNNSLNKEVIENTEIKIFDKVDGSLIKLFYNSNTDQWLIGTRGGAGENNMYKQGSKLSYLEVFVEIVSGTNAEELVELNHSISEETKWDRIEIALRKLNDFCDTEDLNKNVTYIFEMCSPFNSNVVSYDDVVLSLLGASYNGLYGYDTHPELFDVFTNGNNQMKLDLQLKMYFEQLKNGVGVFEHQFKNRYISYPKIYELNNDINEIIKTANMFKGREAEGFVIHFNGIPMIKIKSKDYVNIHNIISNGSFTANNAINIALTHEENEYLAICPDRESMLQPYLLARDKAKLVCEAIYEQMVLFLKENNLINEIQYKQALNHDYPNLLKDLNKEGSKLFFVLSKNNNGEALKNMMNKEMQVFVNEQAIGLAINMLKGNSYHHVLLNLNTKQQFNWIVYIMSVMGYNYRDYELRTGGAVLNN